MVIDQQDGVELVVHEAPQLLDGALVPVRPLLGLRMIRPHLDVLLQRLSEQAEPVSGVFHLIQAGLVVKLYPLQRGHLLAQIIVFRRMLQLARGRVRIRVHFQIFDLAFRDAHPLGKVEIHKASGVGIADLDLVAAGRIRLGHFQNDRLARLFPVDDAVHPSVLPVHVRPCKPVRLQMLTDPLVFQHGLLPLRKLLLPGGRLLLWGFLRHFFGGFLQHRSVIHLRLLLRLFPELRHPRFFDRRPDLTLLSPCLGKLPVLLEFFEVIEAGLHILQQTDFVRLNDVKRVAQRVVIRIQFDNRADAGLGRLPLLLSHPELFLQRVQQLRRRIPLLLLYNWAVVFIRLFRYLPVIRLVPHLTDKVIFAAADLSGAKSHLRDELFVVPFVQ